MHSVGEPVVQRGVESWMPQFGYGVGLELSDSLTGDVKVLADLFEGAGLTAVEVSFVASYDETFDQAGLLVRVDPTTWVQAGVEISDGVPQLGAVATRGFSDWSMAGRAQGIAGRRRCRERPDASGSSV